MSTDIKPYMILKWNLSYSQFPNWYAQGYFTKEKFKESNPTFSEYVQWNEHAYRINNPEVQFFEWDEISHLALNTWEYLSFMITNERQLMKTLWLCHSSWEKMYEYFKFIMTRTEEDPKFLDHFLKVKKEAEEEIRKIVLLAKEFNL